MGVPYRKLRNPLRRVGVVLDTRGFIPSMSGKKNLDLLATGMGVAKKRISDVLDLVEIADAAGRAVKGYSLGMKQRLSLACALLGDPELLILDEPANGLDPLGIAWLRQFLRSLQAEGRTILVSSHQLAEMQNTIDDVIIINRGKLIAHDSLDIVKGHGSLEEAFLRLTGGAER
jgi:ABC-2 type transport system ATP-binding protein